jgi:transcriptional regulator with XRE-family HTH domain
MKEEPSEFNKMVGARLKTARERAGISQRELGNALGLSESSYRLEAGWRGMTCALLLSAALELEVTTDFLFGIELEEEL